mmetsp:Transcript_8611/g.16671  ORF Transcript_8611/g.16671 Transcript_8611/m.16671 type:complete len:228 (+) Transcript_8611:281-964(+)
MLAGCISNLSESGVVLASKSPRRFEILRQIGLKFSVRSSKFAEDLNHSSFDSPKKYVQETARRKAVDVWEDIMKDKKAHLPGLLIAADTIVIHKNVVLEKPHDSSHAFKMLKTLSGDSHEVVTAVVLLTPGQEGASSAYESRIFYETTQVTFADLTDDIIKSYVDTKEPMDKAGGYGIQGIGGSFVSGITGCYYNVMGFPLHRFCAELLKWSPSVLKGKTNESRKKS